MLFDVKNTEKLVNDYLNVSDKLVWNRFAHFEKYGQGKEAWAGPPLSKMQLMALKTAFLVEDHIPGYSSEYMRLFPVNQETGPDQSRINRIMMHFILRWCSEEDRHAHALELYLRNTNQVEGIELSDDMLKEGMKKYSAFSADHAALFVYTTIQERATAIFYKCLANSVEDPLLKEIMNKLIADETRHANFFSECLMVAMQNRGPEIMPTIQETLDKFYMPLADTMENYKRRSIVMLREAKGYTWHAGLDYLKKLVEKFHNLPTTRQDEKWQEFLTQAAAVE
jgi:acyl-[acyl-carrier-protein] desaturase